jgi:hypothetical protein
MKATPNIIPSNHGDICPTSVSNAGDVMIMSSSQNKGLNVNYSAPTNKDPQEGKTTAVIAIMRGKPKDGYYWHCSNKHYKQKLVRVLLDSGSDNNLIFVSKDRLILLPYSKRLVPLLWNTLIGNCGTKGEIRTKSRVITETPARNLSVAITPNAKKASKREQDPPKKFKKSRSMRKKGLLKSFGEEPRVPAPTTESMWNFTPLGLPLSEYSAILPKSLPNKIPMKFHLLRKFLQNSTRSGLGLNSKLTGNPGMCLVHN